MSAALELYEKLKPRLGEDETKALLAYIESTGVARAATREDLLELQAEFHALRSDLDQLQQLRPQG